MRSDFPTRVARADFTGDVLLRSPSDFRYVFSAFAAMLCEYGRVVEPFRSSTLYISGSRAARTKRMGRIYDKGLERAAAAGWDVPVERYLRIEAERVWEAERPQLSELTSDLARSTFLDRFGTVGKGTVALKDGLVGALGVLFRGGEISVAQYEQLYAFLDLERMGLARRLYPRGTYLRRARVARRLALQVPNDRVVDGPERAIDVRALVGEIAARF